MTQAYYGPQHIGHFGLALRSYAHFTSPIRRYSDLIVHRALITAHGWGKDGLRPEDYDALEQTGAHISDTERRSMMAERDTTDRYLASYLSERVGNEFQGRVSGIARFGVFVKLDETGADGLLPMRSIGNEYFHYDGETQSLMGADTGMVISLGQRVTVRLAEAVPVTGGIALELLELEGAKVPQGRQSPAGRSPRRKSAKGKRKKDKIKRKVSRTRR
jgi:ribonuclease R